MVGLNPLRRTTHPAGTPGQLPVPKRPLHCIISTHSLGIPRPPSSLGFQCLILSPSTLGTPPFIGGAGWPVSLVCILHVRFRTFLALSQVSIPHLRVPVELSKWLLFQTAKARLSHAAILPVVSPNVNRSKRGSRHPFRRLRPWARASRPRAPPVRPASGQRDRRDRGPASERGPAAAPSPR